MENFKNILYSKKVLTKQDKVNRKTAVFFILFMLTVAMQKANYLIYLLTGVNIQKGVPFSLLAVPFAFLVIVFFISKDKVKLTNKSYLPAILIWSHVNLLYGLIMENHFMSILWEYYIGAIMFFSYKLASNKTIWKLFETKLISIYLIFSFLVFTAKDFFAEHLTVFSEKLENITTASLAYEIAPILDFWPFIFLFGITSSKKGLHKVLTISALIIYLAFQFYFLKRAPSVRALTYFVVGNTMLMLKRGEASAIFKYLGIVFICFFLLTYAIPDGLIERFKTEDTSRQNEFANMVSSANVIELIIGRGLGGSYPSDNLYDYIAEDGSLRRVAVHIGYSFALLKGGIILCILILLHVLASLSFALKRLKGLNNRQFVSVVFLIVYSIYRLIEGSPSTGQIFDGVLFGLALGCLDDMRNKSTKNFVTTQ